MRTEYDVSTGDDKEIGVPVSKRSNWKIVLGFLAFLAVSGLTLTTLYGVRPKKYEVLAKRTSPPVRSVYALVLSPMDSVTASHAVDSMRAIVCTRDSADVNMVIGSTKIYKRFVSAAEFCRVFEDALRAARPVEIDKQAVLISQLSGILIKDTLRTKLCLFGRLASSDFEGIKKQLSNAASIIVQRNNIVGPVEIVSFLEPNQSDAVAKFLEYFSKRGIVVTQKTIQ